MKVRAGQPVAHQSAGLGKQALHAGRVGKAHGVGQAHAVGTGVEQSLHQAQHFALGHLALQGAAKRGAHTAFDQGGAACRIAGSADAGHLGNHLIRRLAQVGQAVGAAGR